MDWRTAATISLDTAPIIYHLEDHPELGPLVLPVFREIETGERRAVTATLTLLEVLVGPYRLGDDARRAEMTALLTSYPTCPGSIWISSSPTAPPHYERDTTSERPTRSRWRRRSEGAPTSS